jgi:hypothetical protein
MTRPAFPNRALLSPKTSGPSSPHSPLSPRFPGSGPNRRQSSGSGLSEAEQKGQEEVELPDICHAPTKPEKDADAIEEDHGHTEEEHEVEEQRAFPDTGKISTISSTIEGNGWWPSFRRMWIRHVSIRVPVSDRRDHLGKT